MMTTAMMNYELYADAVVAVRESQRPHAIAGTLLGEKTSLVWMDTNEVALPEDVAAELGRVEGQSDAVRDTFRMDLAETLADEFRLTPEVTTMLVRQVEVFAEDSYECIIGCEEDTSYWKHLARRASELAEIVAFALNENKEG